MQIYIYKVMQDFYHHPYAPVLKVVYRGVTMGLKDSESGAHARGPWDLVGPKDQAQVQGTRLRSKGRGSGPRDEAQVQETRLRSKGLGFRADQASVLFRGAWVQVEHYLGQGEGERCWTVRSMM